MDINTALAPLAKALGMSAVDLSASVVPLLITGAYFMLTRYGVTVLAFIAERLTGLILSLQAKVNESKIGAMLKTDDMLFGLAAAAVAAVNDSYVQSIKDASADGKLTPEEITEANARALAVFKSSLTKDQLQHLLTHVGEDFMSVVAARLPSVVAGLKGLGAQAAAPKPVQQAAAALLDPPTPEPVEGDPTTPGF